MTLASLLYPDPIERGMDVWTFANLQHHRAIGDAIFRTRGVRIAEFQIWPVKPDNFDDFLRQHQQWHDAINAELGVPGIDLQSVDFQDPQQRDAWIWLHFNSHRNWAGALGGGI